MLILETDFGGQRARDVVRLAHHTRTTRHISLADALADPAYIAEMLHLGGHPGMFASYRPTIRRLTEALRAQTIDFAVHNLCDVRAAVIEQARLGGRVLLANSAGLRVLPDLIVYGQSQGLIPQGKWSRADLDDALAFRKQLVDEGLLDQDALRNFRVVVHFIIWARLHCVDNDCLGDEVIERFAGHECYCSLGARGKTDFTLNARHRAMRRWRRFRAGEKLLTEHGSVRRENRKPAPPLAPSVAAFKAYMEDHRGFHPSTIKSYINDLALWHLRLGEDAKVYDAKLIREICQGEFSRRTPGAQTRFLTVLRGYLTFRAMRGECDPQLLTAIISRPSYTQGTIPKTMPFETLRGFIAACDIQTPVGLRARAVMTLLLETGIRAKEVGSIKIDDIDWERGHFLIDAKGRQREAMPLPQNAGNAILDWIEKGRPKTDDPHLFIRLRRPYQPINLNSGISTIVQSELRKQGVARSGAAHVFRHSFARKHLHSGLTLPQIGRLLRHQMLDTTQIYAKVDDKMLAATAQEWPGEVS